MSRIETIAKEKRKELETKNRYKFKTEYNKTSKDIYSEGINGDNFGKEPSSISSAELTDSYFNTGGRDDIKARMSPESPGNLTQNKYGPAKPYSINNL